MTAKRVAELAPRVHGARGQQRQHLLLEAAVARRCNSATTSRWVVSALARHQFQIDRRRSRRGAVLAGQQQAVPAAAEVEVGVAEGVQVAGAAQPLAGGHSARGVFAGVMHQHHREVQLPLQRAEVGQQPGHFAGVVLVDAVKPHQRIQQQQPGPQPLGRFQEPPAVRIAVQPERRGGDHVDLDPGQIQAAMPGHARHALADHRQGVLGQVDQDRAGRGTAYLPRQAVPVATLKARSSPSQVLEHLGAPPITPTDESPQSCSTSQRWALSSRGISATRTTGSG